MKLSRLSRLSRLSSSINQSRYSRRSVAQLACAAIFLLAACSQQPQLIAAQELDADTACALDGMILMDYPGPKAQLHYAEGEPDFFCDLTELFSVVLIPEQKRRIAALYVQDMGKTSWAQPSGNWIDAKTAFYVVGSKKRGSMGATFGSFSNEQDAIAFMQQEGGKVFPYEEIRAEMIGSSVHTHEHAHDSAH